MTLTLIMRPKSCKEKANNITNFRNAKDICKLSPKVHKIADKFLGFKYAKPN